MGSLVDDNSVSRARKALERLHVDTVAHSRLTESVSDTGAVTKTYASQGNLKCRIETRMGNRADTRISGTEPADTLVYDYVVFCAHDADIRNGDRFTKGGTVMSVVQNSRNQSQNFVTVAYCSEVI